MPAETDGSTGAVLREYVWEDEVPVAQASAGPIVYLHTDHLGTPRLGTNSVGAEVWRWDSDAFGTTAPTGSAVVNLRFPGQYFDAETGLHYNWHRTYNPASGRYVESDPIGLAGGLNTFGYVGGNPNGFMDHAGLAAICGQCSPGDTTCLLYGGNLCNPGHSGIPAMGYTKPSSCGSGFKFPNKLNGKSIDRSCQNHDQCYGTCGSDKNQCDLNFLKDLLKTCRGDMACRSAAYGYHWAVETFGEGPFINAKKGLRCTQQ